LGNNVKIHRPLVALAYTIYIYRVQTVSGLNSVQKETAAPPIQTLEVE
jgi:hypothetical protein